MDGSKPTSKQTRQSRKYASQMGMPNRCKMPMCGLAEQDAEHLVISCKETKLDGGFATVHKCGPDFKSWLEKIDETRMQSIDKVRYKGVYDAISTIYQREGYKRLLRGMSAMLTGAGPAHAMYFACYEKVKYKITFYASGGKQNSSLANGIAGATATVFHDLVMNPAEVIKQRMQVFGSIHKTPIQCISAILKSEGVSAFYRSFPTQLILNIPFQAVHFVVYEWTQEEINPTRTYNPVTHMASGAVAGACSAFITNPLDVCRTLLNTQELLQKNKVEISGLRQAWITIFRAAGVKTFFRGVTARVLFQMPSTAISWSVYELFKHLLFPPNVGTASE